MRAALAGPNRHAIQFVDEGRRPSQAHDPSVARRRWRLAYVAVLSHLAMWIVTLFALSRIFGGGS